jgi:hypothetical protein
VAIDHLFRFEVFSHGLQGVAVLFFQVFMDFMLGLANWYELVVIDNSKYSDRPCDRPGRSRGLQH